MKKLFSMKKLVLLLSLQLWAAMFCAQEEPDTTNAFEMVEKINPKKDIKTGNKYFEELNYKQAMHFYLKAYKVDSLNPKLNVFIGDCYLNTLYKSKALRYLEKAVKLDPGVRSEDIDYLLGQAYHYNSKWQQAIVSYKKFLRTSIGASMKPQIDKKIQECQSGAKLVKVPVNVKIENLGPEINSSLRDFAPVISADESVIYFTSKRPFITEDGTSILGYENIFTSVNDGKKWTKAKQLEETVNTPNQNNSAIAISIDGQRMLIYKEENDGDFYESALDGDKWEVPTKLSDVLNTKNHESTASIAFDGKIIYFVSDRPGGLGGRDIYKSTIDAKGNFSPPQNLGKEINTPYNEEGVVIHPDGKTLYFNSEGHNSMGGYDIFKTVNKRGKWSKPENLGYPINTPDNDGYFVISASGQHGYYSSVRDEGFGENDIYRITWVEEKKTGKDSAIVSKPKTPQVTLLKGIVINEEKTPLEADIVITDNTSGEVVAKFKSNSSTGKYLLSLPSGRDYGIAVNKQAYLFHSENFNIADSIGYNELFQTIVLKQIKVGSKIVLNNIFFDFNKSTLRNESTSELNRMIQLLNENPDIRVEISGHTDNVGSVEYNQKLSEARSKAVVDYLIRGGVASNRLVYKGYGFEKPIATNDSEEGRQQNRRTEFEIIK